MADFPRRFGKYLLVDHMAMGGMAELFLAVERTEDRSHRFLTIKQIRSDFDRDDEFVQFFRTEGQVLMMCSHANLPQGYAMGQVDGTHFLALEYIHGCTLLELVRAAAIGRKPLSVSSALSITIGVAAALDHAHCLRDVDGSPLGVIHRDVTPQNIMIAESGVTKLIDFGIARAALQTHRTQVGVVKGKFAYMAPEMVRGRGRIDQRADIFSLGIVLHETLTGRALFRGKNDADTLDRIRHMAVPDLRTSRMDVPESVWRVLKQALEREPQKRFQSAGEFLRALKAAASSEKIHCSTAYLRQEVIDRCGFPDAPILSQTHRAALSGRLGSTDERNFVPSMPYDDPTTSSAPVTIATTPTAPRAIERDPRLAYYLRKAGALLESRSSDRDDQ